MPAARSTAQSEASRRNGALSSGPTTEEGKARSALNGTRHGLCGAFRLLEGEDAAAFEALRLDFRRRHAPEGEAEGHWCDELARAAWRQRRLFALEEAAFAPPPEGDKGPSVVERLPTLATLVRYRARAERDTRLAREQLAALQAERRRLRPDDGAAVAADRLRAVLASLGEEPPPARAPCHHGTSEPEPLPAPAGRPLNRQQRRRLAALRRRDAA